MALRDEAGGGHGKHAACLVCSTWKEAVVRTTPMYPSRPFSNGTEERAWMDAWCNHCDRDHGMHNGNDNTDDACPIVLQHVIGDGTGEAWIAEPDDGKFYLPSRMICTLFEPCTPCGGDPDAVERAERVAEVTAYWRDRLVTK